MTGKRNGWLHNRTATCVARVLFRFIDLLLLNSIQLWLTLFDLGKIGHIRFTQIESSVQRRCPHLQRRYELNSKVSYRCWLRKCERIHLGNTIAGFGFKKRAVFGYFLMIDESVLSFSLLQVSFEQLSDSTEEQVAFWLDAGTCKQVI